MNNNTISTRSIGDLIDDVNDKRLTVKPLFQRRQVWNNADKERFIDTISKGYPFPEIFVATSEREDSSTRRLKVLVDGQQRLSTIIAYVEGTEDLLYKTIRRFDQLEQRDRDAFLEYSVAVRELGTASIAVVRDIFSRINSTDYALKAMERLNAMFSGAYIRFCEQLSRNSFFEVHKVFPKGHQKRMRDVNFCVILVTTILSGYYNRDEKNREYLELYNEAFDQVDAVQTALDRVFDFVESCRFLEKSRAWRQTDLFTLLVEVHTALIVKKLDLSSEEVGPRVEAFYTKVGELYATGPLTEEPNVPARDRTVFAYMKAATKATNDKYARVERANIISKLLAADGESETRPKKRRAKK